MREANATLAGSNYGEDEIAGLRKKKGLEFQRCFTDVNTYLD